MTEPMSDEEFEGLAWKGSECDPILGRLSNEARRARERERDLKIALADLLSWFPAGLREKPPCVHLDGQCWYGVVQAREVITGEAIKAEES